MNKQQQKLRVHKQQVAPGKGGMEEPLLTGFANDGQS
jgi:hypothetical protein